MCKSTKQNALSLEVLPLAKSFEATSLWCIILFLFFLPGRQRDGSSLTGSRWYFTTTKALAGSFFTIRLIRFFWFLPYLILSLIFDHFDFLQEDLGGGGQRSKHDGPQDLLHHPRLLQGGHQDKDFRTFDQNITLVFFKEHALQELRDVTGRKVRKVNWARSSYYSQMSMVEHYVGWTVPASSNMTRLWLVRCVGW